MSKCDNCRLKKEFAKAFDIHWFGKDDCPYDVCPIKTNADFLRGMTDDELADWFSIYCCRNKTYDAHCETFGTCKACWSAWLKEEHV